MKKNIDSLIEVDFKTKMEEIENHMEPSVAETLQSTATLFDSENLKEQR